MNINYLDILIQQDYPERHNQVLNISVAKKNILLSFSALWYFSKQVCSMRNFSYPQQRDITPIPAHRAGTTKNENRLGYLNEFPSTFILNSHPAPLGQDNKKKACQVTLQGVAHDTLI
ncbi:MAG: hypothetical protein D3910_25720 [Candidatus Electrothrix sp. ATG2]|nr:hypothetical protein [Candidatus Electrothrix sp. ATG2]